MARMCVLVSAPTVRDDIALVPLEARYKYEVAVRNGHADKREFQQWSKSLSRAYRDETQPVWREGKPVVFRVERNVRNVVVHELEVDISPTGRCTVTDISKGKPGR